MAKVKKLTKPKKHTETFWDYHEVAHYLEQLHGKKFRDYAGRFSSPTNTDAIPYQDFWLWICDNNQVTNGCFIRLPEWDYFMNNEDTEPWKKEIMQYFKDFLGADYDERLWVEW